MCSRGTLATAASTCHALYRPVTPECVRDADCLLEGSRFEPSVPPANGPLRQNANDFREIEKGRKYPFSRGTGSSNPAPSSGVSGANLSLAGIRLSRSRSHGFPRRPSRDERRGRQRHTGRGNIGLTGDNVSVGPHSSTAPPVMRRRRCHADLNEVGPFSGLMCGRSLSSDRVKQNRARSADRARRAADVSARAAFLRSDRVADARRGSLW